MAPTSKPVFILVPGASQSPAHSGYLQHLPMAHDYSVLSALLPSVDSSAPVTVRDDTDYVRSHMLLPLLDGEKHDVIIISTSYSGLPASAAAYGLGKADRVAEGKMTSVLGQFFIASVLTKGGEGKDLVATFCGQLPQHIQADVGEFHTSSLKKHRCSKLKGLTRVKEAENLLKWEDPKSPLFQEVSPGLADAAAASSLNQCMTSFKSPCPAATWDAEAFKGRCAYIRTLNDQAVPYEVQNMMIRGTEQEWIMKDIETGHSPQLVAPEKLSAIIPALPEHFQGI